MRLAIEIVALALLVALIPMIAAIGIVLVRLALGRDEP